MSFDPSTTQALEKYFPDYAKPLSEGHPIKTYLIENFFLQRILQEFEGADPHQNFQTFFNIFNQLCEVEKRYARKENQLFPYLEKRGWNGPSQGMWAFHDSIRDMIRAVRTSIQDKNLSKMNQMISILVSEMRRLIAVEEMRLFPISLQLLTEEDWKTMRQGEAEIGWMSSYRPLQNEVEVTPTSSDDKRLRLEEGFLTPEQINLMLKHIPVDLTYVDENDRVLYYNRGEERVFPRSPGIIGREVRFCHPPKSVGTVLRILEEFKNGSKNEAEFWIRFKDRVIHIRYFAVRSKDLQYKGVIEMSQDITDIQKLEGERRLLNWDTP